MNTSKPYRFLPFRFTRKNNEVLLINDFGEYLFTDKKSFDKLISFNLHKNSEFYQDLISKNIIIDKYLAPQIDILATKFRTKKSFLLDFTSLHMIVLTLRCNHCCSYCHASSIDNEGDKLNDMDINTAFKCIEFAFSSPSPHIKLEYQGGESILNCDVLKYSIDYAYQINEKAKKELEIVICTNLIGLTTDIISFIKNKNIFISTSFDGPKDIHDENRKMRNNGSSYDLFIEKLNWLKEEIGMKNISALMTITTSNIYRLNEVIDEYIKQGFSSIFLRDLNRYGRAKANSNSFYYPIEDYLESYKNALDYILNINKQGKRFNETYATLLLSKILTPFSTGFVDLQSPSGAGICGVIYDYQGDIFVSDEARMLSYDGDKYFKIGNVKENFYKDVFECAKLKEITKSSCLESFPGCSWCVYLPYCGSDPVRNYIYQKESNSIKVDPYFCKKHKGLFEIFFDYLKNNDQEEMDIFWSWITGKPTFKDEQAISKYL